VKKHVYFSIVLTLLLVISGVVTIPMVSQYDHWTQNWIYALGRVPIILGASLAFSGRGEA
jgi:uncharacterized membrane protein HdeD (DUF308 family)